ncbi:P-loop containing nucleoside triphosphate hydrolase protein [Pelagophyceae sp. CCMP2097]|nr:P-loop containing nucleoside triphosphate hydrolase protein [Pelagophyceae sp. CCMP2097]
MGVSLPPRPSAASVAVAVRVYAALTSAAALWVFAWVDYFLGAARLKRIARRRLAAPRLRRLALDMAGVRSEAYHVPVAEMDRRVAAVVDAVVSASDGDALAACGARGEDLGLGVVAVAVLQNRLVRQLIADLLVTAAASDAGVAMQDLGEPLVIVGLPRSGTTLLLELLALDDLRWRPLVNIEAMVPCAPPGGARKPLRDSMVLMAAGLQTVSDRLKHVHYEAWDGPTECRTALENGLNCPLVWFWLFGVLPAVPQDYKLYETQLKVLQVAAPREARQWILKDPMHLANLAGLFAALPGARVVWLHRKPEAAVASMSSLVAALWRLLYSRRGGAAPGSNVPFARVLGVLGGLVDSGLAFRAQHPDKPVFDVQSADFFSDPLDAVERVYAFAGAPSAPAARAKMAAHLAKRGRGEEKQHVYTAADFGLDDAVVAKRFQAYKAKHGV